MSEFAKKAPVHGLIAEFEQPHDLVEAATAAHEAGYRRMDAYSPLPIHGLAAALGHTRRQLPWIVFAGGIAGCLAGFGFQYWVSVIAYPTNIGGRPLNSWPAFIPVTFEMTILAAAFAAVFGMLALNGLPRPHHPIFNHPRFALASKDRFFLCIEARDPGFDGESTRKFLEGLNPREVAEVEA